jgi:hypothetical protein
MMPEKPDQMVNAITKTPVRPEPSIFYADLFLFQCVLILGGALCMGLQGFREFTGINRLTRALSRFKRDEMSDEIALFQSFAPHMGANIHPIRRYESHSCAAFAR